MHSCQLLLHINMRTEVTTIETKRFGFVWTDSPQKTHGLSVISLGLVYKIMVNWSHGWAKLIVVSDIHTS